MYSVSLRTVFSGHSNSSNSYLLFSKYIFSVITVENVYWKKNFIYYILLGFDEV